MIRKLTRLRQLDQTLDRAVREAMVETLFASTSSLLSGAITGAVVATTIAWAAGDHAISLVAAAICLVGLWRVVFATYHKRQLARGTSMLNGRTEALYELGAFGFAGLLGLLGLLTLTRTSDSALHLMIVVTNIGYAAGISGRNAGRPLIAISQLILATLPIIIGLLSSPNSFHLALGGIGLIFIFAMIDITMQTYDSVWSALILTQEKGQLAQHYERLACTDTVTGLANRSGCFEMLDQQIGQGAMALIWVDLDHFKDVNDSLGHPVGDKLLIAAAERMKATLGSRGSIARYGGDEFVILCPGTDRAAAREIGTKILADLALPIEADGHILTISASAGAALVPDDATERDALIKHADIALYLAKSEGRNRLCFFEAGMYQTLRRRRILQTDLALAVANDGLHLVFQPIVLLATGEIAELEALVRWSHPEFGVVAPDEFIELAERTGIIIRLGAWVLAAACAEAARWPDHVGVTVNISPTQLHLPGLPDTIRAALRDARLPPERLKLEVTEHVMLTYDMMTLRQLANIRATGVGLALDDFGTGYSSLISMQRFNFDDLKIDAAFFTEIDTNHASLIIVAAVIDLAHRLGLSATAEGIETAFQYEAVRQSGCDRAQGRFIGAPLLGDEALGLLLQPATRPERTAVLH